MSANGYTKEEVIDALHGIAGEMHNKMLKGEPPTMTLPVRTKQNISFDERIGVFKYGNPVNSEEFQQNKTMQILIHPIWWISEGNNRLDKILWHKNKQKNSVETNLKNNLNFYGK